MSTNTIKKSDARKKAIVLYLAIVFVIGAFVPSVSSDLTDPWWNSDWHYRKEITINHAKVATDLTNFSVLLHFTDPDLSLKAQPDGDDIAFASKTGNKLNHEIESYNSTSGDITAWVQIPFLGSTQDTPIYLYYGNQNCSSQQNNEGTWDTHFLAVHHLEETTGTIYDSTNYNNDGIPFGDLNQNTQGRIDGADYFDGANDHITLPQVYSTQNQFTMEAWIYPQPGARYFLSQRSTNGVLLQITDGGNYLQWYINGVCDGISGIPWDTWYYIVLTYDGTTARLYKNAETPRSKTCSPPSWPTEGMYISDRSAGSRPFHGIIDEVRFSNIARDTAWIATCYNNQNNPSSFYQIGAEYHAPQAPIITNERPIDSSTNVSRYLSSLSFNLSHPDGKLMTCTVTSMPDITSGSQTRTNVANTTVYIPITQIPLDPNTQYSWSVAATDGTKWTNKTYVFTTEQPVITDPWWNADWQYRKKILINHTNIAADLTNFPLLIHIIDSNLSLNAQSDGDDIVFASKTGNKLNYEIETYNAINGDLTAWVNIPFLSHTNDTMLYLYYGNSICTNQQNIEATWNPTYVGVWHMTDATPTIIDDSTTGNHNGVKRGLGEPSETLAKINKGQLFDGTNDYVNSGNNNIFELNRFTASLWIKPNRLTWCNMIIGKYLSSTAGEWYLSFSATPPYNKLRVVLIDSDGLYQWQESATPIPLDTWTHIDLVYDGTLAFYINGVRDANTRVINKNVRHSASANLVIGNNLNSNYPFKGVIDEVRISNLGRDTNWLSTSYNNENNPEGFHTLGAEETYYPGPVISNARPADGAINVTFNPLLQADINDPNHDYVEWEIESNSTGTWTLLSSGAIPDGNGTVSALPLTMNNFNTTYWWKVSATDPAGSGLYSIRVFRFTTKTTSAPPEINNPFPANDATGVALNPTLAIDVTDSDGDTVNIHFKTNASGSWEDIGSYTNVSNGRYQQTTTMNRYAKTYWWCVNTTDPMGSGQWTNQTYRFTTLGNNLPVISNIYPTNQNANYNPRLSAYIQDSYGDSLTVIFKTNASGTWETLGNYSDGNGLYSQNTQHMDIKGKNYYWSLHVTDGTGWINQTFRFTAQPFVLKWTSHTNANTGIGPLADDVNNDSIYEVFTTGQGKITCVNGSTGAIIWSYSNPEIQYHSPFVIADLNNDGIPEVIISGNETLHEGGRTIALHANNGSVYWNVIAESGGKYICVADIEGNGYPYVYVTSGSPYGGAWLKKLRGTDGTVLKKVSVWRPCWGGPAVADADNDGNFEVYLTDRSVAYTAGERGKGMQCYDAQTLDLLWYQDAVTCSSHTMALIDVNHDGILDAVALQQRSNNGGIYVVDGATWDKMPGYWRDSITGLSSHSQPSIFDIDGDGKIEVIAVRGGYTPARMWELGIWNQYKQFNWSNQPQMFQEPPKMADVIGDDKLEIIGASTGVKIYDSAGNQIPDGSIGASGIDTTLVQDIDNDGQNELIILSGDGILQTYDTSAYAPIPRVRTNVPFYSERNLGAGVYIPPPGAPQPIIKEVIPQNGAQDITINPTLCAHVVDFHYDRMNITISTNASGTWEDIATYHNVGNAWYNITTSSMNQPQTTYYWRVSAIDSWADKRTTIQTYSFTTSTSPVISNIVATPPSANQGQPINISCHVTDNDRVNLVKINVTYPDGHSTNTTANAIKPGWQVLSYDDFETGSGNHTGNYTIGVGDCFRDNSGNARPGGTWAMLIRDYQGINSSFYYTQGKNVDTPQYTSLKVDFWFKAVGTGAQRNFWVKYYDGAHWRIVGNYYSRIDFMENNFYHKSIWINETQYTFPSNMKIRFECDGLVDSDKIYIDQVYVNATTGQSVDYYSKMNYTQPGTYHYYIWAKDQYGNSIRSPTYTFGVGNEYILTTTTSGTGSGTIETSPTAPYFYNDVVTLWANASIGSTFKGWSGALTGTTTPQTLVMTSNKTVNAEFTRNTQTIMASAGLGGSISPSGAVSVFQGADQDFVITADSGYHILDVLVDGGSVGPVSSYTFTNVIADHTIVASFEINHYNIFASAGFGGVITPSGNIVVAHGANQQFTFTPTVGYHINDILIDNISAGASSSYTFTNVITNHTITATFAINQYTISATASQGGSITPSGAVVVNYGGFKNFSFTANTGHHLLNVLVDGGSVGTVSYYNFTNVIANHSIAATFAPDIYILTITTNGTGSGTVQANTTGPYTYGTIVKLWANASTGSIFSGWNGALSGTTTPQTLIMDSDKSVNAQFTHLNQPPTHNNPLLISEYGTNTTDEKLICKNQSTVDPEGNPVYNTYHWIKNGMSVPNLLLSFNTANATNVKDYSGYHNNGTVINGTTWISSGKIGGAYKFDGTNDYISIPDASSLDGDGTWNAMTMEFWVKSGKVDQKNSTILEKRGSTSATQSYQIGFSSTNGGRLYCGYYLSTAYQTTATSSSTPILAKDVWYHVVSTYKSGEGLKIYVNGSLYTSLTYTTPATIKASDNIPVNIGRRRTDTTKFLNGSVDEVKIYPFALTPQQISQNYNDSKNGYSNVSKIVKEQTSIGDVWRCEVTPSDGQLDGLTKASNSLTIVPLYTLTITKSGTGSGTVEVKPSGPYFSGTVVTLWANASTGSTFTGWSGALSGMTTPETLTINGNKSVNAQFTLNGPYTLTLTPTGTGSGTIQVNNSGPYYYGAKVKLWANASVGSSFTGWNGALTGTTTPQNLVMDGDKSVSAQFTLNGPYTLTIGTTGTGVGTIQTNISGPYYYGAKVKLWANASTGSMFTGWSGALSGTNTPETLIMDGDKTVSAVFTLNNFYILTITQNGTGSGSVATNASGPYFYGTKVKLWANTSVGSTFTGWSGALTGTTTPQTLTMDGNKSVNAQFTLNGPYTLTITTNGTGSGTVQTNISAPYYYGAKVKLWANASVGSTFTGWYGALSGTTTPKTLVMDTDKTVIAKFTSTPFLSINSNFDSGNIGSYTINGNTINCTLNTEHLLNSGADYTYWTNFKVQNTLNKNITFHITNANLVPFLTNTGHEAQMVYSYDGTNWNRFTNHTYAAGTYRFWKNFTANQVQIATFFPFSYSTMQEYLETVNTSQWAVKTVLGKSVQNRDIDLLTITNPGISNATKKVVYIIGRQHAAETASSHMLKGLIDFLISNNSDARRLRDSFVWYIIPMVNPDGVYLGDSRGNGTVQTIDINREWDSSVSTEINIVKNHLSTIKNTVGVDFFIDWHNQMDEVGWYNYIYAPPETNSYHTQGETFFTILSQLTDFDTCTTPGLGSNSARGYATNLGIFTFTFEPTPHLFTWTLDKLHEQGMKVAYAIDQHFPLLLDSEFNDSTSSEDLRANATTRDWYESRNNDPLLVGLDTNNIGGNLGKKAGFYTQDIQHYTYLSQEFRTRQTGRFTVSLDLLIDSISIYYDAVSKEAYNRTAFIFIGSDDSDHTNGPCTTSNERFVFLTFFDNNPVENASDIVLKARESSGQPWNKTVQWTTVMANLSYDTWYRLTLDVDVANHSYDVYVNDVLVGEDISGYNNYVSDSISHITFYAGGTARGTFYVDNVFSPASERHSLKIAAQGNGSVSKTPGEATYRYGSTVQITAAADIGWTFDHWAGDLSGSTNPKTIALTSEMNVTAVFTQNHYTLTTNIDGTGSITRTPQQSTFVYNESVMLQATGSSGWNFTHWTGNFTGHVNPVTLKITHDMTITAHFSNTALYTLTTNTIGSGHVECNPDRAVYEPSATVTLTPIGNPGWTFNNWTGNVPSGHKHDNPLSITMDANKLLTASFNSSQPTVLTEPVLNITSTSATLQGYINDTGGENCSVWFEWDNSNVEECMGIIATGTVCKDGRSILQKNRHYYYDNVKPYFYQGTNYSFFGIGDSGTVGQCRMGQNAKGLAINNMDVSGTITHWKYQTDWSSGSQDHDSRYCLGNYSTVRDTAYYLAKHGYYYGNGSTNGQYLIISSEPGVGAIVAIDRVGHTNITWINNTYAGCANSWYCDGKWDTGDYNDKRAKIIMNDIVINGTSSDGDHLLNWQDIVQRVAKDVNGREKGTGSYSYSGQIACGYSRSSVVSVAGNSSLNSSIHMSWLGIGQTTQVCIFLPLYAGNLHSISDIPSNFTTANGGKGIQPYADVKRNYARGNLADGNFYCSRVREILKYTSYNENLTFNTFDNLMDTIMYSADQQEARNRLDAFMETMLPKALHGYIANSTKSSTDTFKHYPQGVGYFSQAITGLKPGTTYYVKAWANNTGSDANGSILRFMTKPEAPSSVQATHYGNQVNLSWTKGNGAFYTIIERNTTGVSSWARGEGIQIYNGTGKHSVDSGVQSTVQYYYKLWSYTTEKGLHQYSTNAATGYTGSNMPPVFTNINPTNGATGVLTNTSLLSVTIQDTEGNPISWTIQTSPNIGSSSATGGNGTKICLISGLTYGTTYTWFVNATDGTSWNNKIYTFTTKVGILVDPDFDASIHSADLRNNSAGQDWYESRGAFPSGADPTLLTLNTSNIGGNTGKKAALKSYGIASNAYLTQEFGAPQSSFFTVSFDINIDRIENNSNIDRTGLVYIGDDSVTTNCPTGTSNERFVHMTFYDPTPGDTGNDIEIRARTSSTQTTATTSTWTQVATSLNYDTWYTIKLTIFPSKGKYNVYVDGVLKGYQINKYSGYATSTVSFISFSADSDGRGDFYVDNVVSVPFTNSVPSITNELPTNSSTGVSLSTSQLSVTISDSDSDLLNYTIQTIPNIGSSSGSRVTGGIKTCNISGLSYSTTYTWYVNVTDGINWTRKIYSFTTETAVVNNPPIFSAVTPANNSNGVPISMASLNLTIQDPEGNTLDWTIQTSPNIGSNAGTTEGNGTKTCSIAGLTYGTLYTWFVNATDGTSWTRKTFFFTAQDGILSDPDFDDSFISTDLRNDTLGLLDWYESRNDVPTWLTLNTENIGGNSGKKAALVCSNLSGTAYLSQEFSSSQTSTFNVSFDIYIDRIYDNGNYDRTAHIFIGNNTGGTNSGTSGPCSTGIERFVCLAFYDSNPSSNDSDIILKARQFSNQSFATTSQWTSIATGLSYDTWYDIRLDIRAADGTYDVYVNDVLKGSNIHKQVEYTSSSITHMSFFVGGNSRGDFYVDNVHSPAIN